MHEQNQSLIEKIKERALSLSISEIGFCSHNGKTAICCLFPYYKGGEESRISLYARSIDYHKVARDKLESLMEPFDNTAEIFVDIGPEDNSSVALKCSLGVMGKNGLIINEELGSWFFIGYALTDVISLPSEDVLQNDLDLKKCLSCNLCIDSCPGNALSDGFDASRCASYISQKKGALTPDEEAILKKSGYIFGCDICQLLCPMNKGKGKIIDEFEKSRILSLDEKELSSMSNRQFLEKYGSYAFSWRGKNVLIRNLKLFE